MVSVIVPVYKVEKYLRCCVDSILSQTYSDIELILVDDGSPDQCGAICDEYARKDSRVKVIHKVNGGVSSARNAGLNLVTGEYVTFCDSDDSYEKNWIEVLTGAIVRNHADAAVGNHVKIQEDGTKVSESQNETGVVDTLEEEAKLCYGFRYLFGYKHCWEIWARMYRTEIIRTHNIRFCETCGNFAEDLGFTLEYSLYSNRVVSVPDAGYCYLIRDGSMMRNSSGIAKLNEVNEMAIYFAAAYRAHFDRKDACGVLPVFHFLLMYDQYQIILAQDRLPDMGKYLQKIQNQVQWREFVKDLFSCYGLLKKYFGTYNARRILMLSHYTLHRNWRRYDLERRIFYKLQKPKA